SLQRPLELDKERKHGVEELHQGVALPVPVQLLPIESVLIPGKQNAYRAGDAGAQHREPDLRPSTHGFSISDRSDKTRGGLDPLVRQKPNKRTSVDATPPHSLLDQARTGWRERPPSKGKVQVPHEQAQATRPSNLSVPLGSLLEAARVEHARGPLR